MDSRSFGQYNVIGDKLEEHGEQPVTFHMFIKMARQQSRLYAASYGAEHSAERLNAIDRQIEIHEERPEYFTVTFLSDMWERMVYQYNVCIAEGIHFILVRYDEGVAMEKIRRYALAPDGQGGTAWKFTQIFDFDDDRGFGSALSCRGLSRNANGRTFDH